MNFMARRLLCHHGTKKMRTLTLNALRLSSTEERSSSKADSHAAQATSTVCSPPPIPPKPPCPTLCPKIPDPNNPCNYCPPPCPDPDYPDLTKLKKLQCKFQEDNGIPFYIKGGTIDVYIYHASLLLTAFSLIYTLKSLYELAKK